MISSFRIFFYRASGAVRQRPPLEMVRWEGLFARKSSTLAVRPVFQSISCAVQQGIVPQEDTLRDESFCTSLVQSFYKGPTLKKVRWNRLVPQQDIFSRSMGKRLPGTCAGTGCVLNRSFTSCSTGDQLARKFAGTVRANSTCSTLLLKKERWDERFVQQVWFSARPKEPTSKKGRWDGLPWSILTFQRAKTC